MRLKLSLLASAVLCLILIAYGQKLPADSAPEPSRPQVYQLVPTEVEFGKNAGEGVTHQLFLLNTQTGQIWRYQPTFAMPVNGRNEVTLETFVPVNVGM